MPISKGFKDIKRWASAPTADRTAPDDASLMPPLVVADGYPASFSADDGNTPRRPVFNEQYHRETSALADIRNYGILPWDAEVDTLQGGLKQVAGVAYRALVDNGPSFSNAVSPTAAGQAVWEILRGVISDPSAPDAPMATAPRSGELDWFWNCPLDGGAQVTEFDFQWRRSGTGSWSPSVPVSTARAVLTSLTNGQPIEARVRARSSHGVGPWSAIGTATPTGTIPGGGSTLALRADAGDAQVTLTWLEPDDGGVTITAYTVQWREDGQAFSSGRQTSVADATATVGSLANGTTYYFRVRAVNGEGNGAWSNEASATPAEDVPDRAIPDQADAPTGQAGNGEARWIATPPSDNGAEITAYIWRFRQTGAPNWSSAITRSIPALTRTGLTNGQTYEAQVRTRNSVGTQSSWSPSGQATPQADVPDQVAFVYLDNVASGIQAEWGAPEANGSAITGYTVQIDDNSSFSSPTEFSPSGTSRLFTGLSEGTTYYVRARATNARGNGAWSPTRSLTRDDGVDVPSAPPPMRAGRARRSRGSDSVGRGTPPRDNGRQITSYELQWREEGNAWSGNVVQRDGSCHVLTGLTAGTTYEARVRAVNSDGVSGWTDRECHRAGDFSSADSRAVFAIGRGPPTGGPFVGRWWRRRWRGRRRRRRGVEAIHPRATAAAAAGVGPGVAVGGALLPRRRDRRRRPRWGGYHHRRYQLHPPLVASRWWRRATGGDRSKAERRGRGGYRRAGGAGGGGGRRRRRTAARWRPGPGGSGDGGAISTVAAAAAAEGRPSYELTGRQYRTRGVWRAAAAAAAVAAVSVVGRSPNADPVRPQWCGRFGC